MKILRLSSLLPAALLGAACGTPTDASREPVAFTHTTSFGFCAPTAYCNTRLELQPRQAVLTYESRQRAAVVHRRALSDAEWSRVADALDEAALRALPPVVGCPDCADGGAEGMSVTFGDGQSDGVTFEYGASVDGVKAVVDALRAVRATFEPPPPAAEAP